MTILEFPEYLPDLPALGNPGSLEARNLLPSGNSYRPAKKIAPRHNSIPGGRSYSYSATTSIAATVTSSFKIQGAFSTKLPSNQNSVMFCGDSKGLYLLNQNEDVWTDVRKASSNYTTADTARWEFTQFDNKVIATNFTDPIQVFTLDSATVFSDLSTKTDVPKAKYIDTVREFLMAGNIDDGSTKSPSLVQWSALGDPTVWQADISVQSGSQKLPTQFGPVTGVVGGEYAVIFQERAISRFDYVGAPIIWQVQTVDPNRGTRYPGSIVQVGHTIYFMGDDGFYVFDGYSSTPIGVNKVDRTFFSLINQGFPNRIYSGVDYKNHLICWAVPSNESPEGIPDTLLYYNFSPNATRRWSYAKNKTDVIFDGLTGGYNMDTIPEYQSRAGQTNGLDGLLPRDLDSDFWISSQLGLNGIAIDSTNNRYFGMFDGDPLTAILETKEVQLNKGQRTEIDLVRPLIDGFDSQISSSSTIKAGTTLFLSVGQRDDLTKPIDFTQTGIPNAIGQVCLRSNARFQRFRLKIMNGFNEAMGIEIVGQNPGGYR